MYREKELYTEKCEKCQHLWKEESAKGSEEVQGNRIVQGSTKGSKEANACEMYRRKHGRKSVKQEEEREELQEDTFGKKEV